MLFLVKFFYEYDIKNIAFLTGAAASGKSRALRNEAIAEKLNLNSYSVIYDSPITDFTIFAKDLAEPLLNKGIKICYIQVYNDPVTTFKNMLHRGVNEGRFLPCLYFLNGMLAQKDRVTAIASEFDSRDGFTYIGINNSENIAKEELCDFKEAEKTFDYNITLSQINKMYEYGEDYRKHLHQERERELRAQDKLEELDKMFMEEIGYYPLLAQREIMKIPLPMSYEDYFMLKWRYSYNSGKAYCTMPEPWKTQWLEWDEKEMERLGMDPL
jgi:hypothetical protein